MSTRKEGISVGEAQAPQAEKNQDTKMEEPKNEANSEPQAKMAKSKTKAKVSFPSQADLDAAEALLRKERPDLFPSAEAQPEALPEPDDSWQQYVTANKQHEFLIRQTTGGYYAKPASFIGRTRKVADLEALESFDRWPKGD
jgi:hypothetical protein